MKKFSRMAGVTLLEVMLVLAVAAMIIVMSIRYYQSATTNQQVNGVLGQFQAIGSAADSLMQGSGSYADASQADVQALMPNQNMNAPWGSPITYTPGTTSYDLSVGGMPEAVAIQVCSRLRSNKKYTSLSGCTGGAFSVTYDATQ